MTRKLLTTLVVSAALAAPLASSAPASAAVNTSARLEASIGASAGVATAHHKPKCVRITAPGSRTVKVEETREVHIRLSKDCRGAKVSYNGMKPVRPNLRHLLYSTAFYIPGEYTLTFRVTLPKGKTVTKAITYKVVEK